MKYVFFGSPRFAAIILEKLLNAGLPPAAIVCNPDKPFGRKKIVTPPLTKSLLANRHAYPAYRTGRRQAGQSLIAALQPENPLAIRDSLLATRPDIFVVAAYAKILPKEILDIPRLGTIGVHPSLLPKYRGATPIQNAILNGDEITGTTLYLMDEKVDHGSILANRQEPIANRNYEELMEKLAELSGELLVETLLKFATGKIKPQIQDEALATYTKKFTAEDAFIKSEGLEAAQSGGAPELSVAIERKIRALNPEPGVWTVRDGKRLKLLEAEIRDNKLRLKKIQCEGKKSEILSP